MQENKKKKEEKGINATNSSLLQAHCVHSEEREKVLLIGCYKMPKGPLIPRNCNLCKNRIGRLRIVLEAGYNTWPMCSKTQG